jgi:acetylglutamate kinase
MRVVKLGGASLARDLSRIAAALARTDEQQVIVHGGGPQVSEMEARLGIPTRKVAGRRITDEASLEVVAMVIGGILHNRVVTALLGAGLRAVGVAGPSVLQARRRPPLTIDGQSVDFGWVGEIERVDAEPVRSLLERGLVPVIPCIAGGDDALFNVNADTTAARIAADLGAEELVQVTDSGGVWRVGNDPSSIIEDLDLSETRELLSSGVASDGMRPKLETAIWALESGVPRVRIVGPEGLGAPHGGTVVRVGSRQGA